MNKQIATYIHDNIDNILDRWKVKMEDDQDDRFFQIMSDQVIDTTVREFGELMVSSLTASGETYDEKLKDFSVQIVRYGWSITFVLRALNNFTEVIYEEMEEAGSLNESNYKSFREILTNWITPLNHSVVDAYSKVWEKTVNLQKIALQELSASLIPVFDKISVMPLVGTIDTERAKLIMENLLQGVVKHRAEVVLLDITGVPVVDTMVAHHIIQAADAVRLVGAKCMLVGIRPEIAQTIVTLGINLTDFTTTSTLQRGMEQALALTNRAIIEVNVK
ncbi:STAS domain-containing protein [Psychrobacillus sp. OK032]|uniref:STAS domain-containing protein n=1 Tax=Psychrobacillus sp. OK032 TaxID=1884358 RepID=UPI0008ACF955|nr:STAS domain-containing protein [Psychrobacillus sp. OK032]SES28425.1 rsbT co-antagonist protein RsbR [Psychrobacillus sp. OK032]